MKLQKRLAGLVMKCSPRRIRFREAELDKIKEAITRFDVKKLVNRGLIVRAPITGTARAKTKLRKAQKRKGRGRGTGTRKGRKSARTRPKEAWMAKVRVQRALLKRLLERNHITKETYKNLYRKVKGGYFRSSRHIKFYLEDQNLFREK